MKRWVGIAFAILTVTSSQASMSLSVTPTQTTKSPAQTAIKKDQALVKSPRVPKPKLFRSNPHRAAHYRNLDDNDDFFIQDEDIATAPRRRDVQKQLDPDEVSDYIAWRLKRARELAMARYRELWG